MFIKKKCYIFKYVCEIYIFFKYISLENPDLYRNRDDFWKEKVLFFYLKDLVFNKNICKMYMLYNIRFSKKCDLQTNIRTTFGEKKNIFYYKRSYI